MTDCLSGICVGSITLSVLIETSPKYSVPNNTVWFSYFEIIKDISQTSDSNSLDDFLFNDGVQWKRRFMYERDTWHEL